MKLLLENWRNYLNESLSETESECMAIFTFGFLNVLRKMQERGPDSVSEEIFDEVSSDVPNARDLYMSINSDDVGKKMEFLKELALEYMAETIAQRYRKNGLDIEDYVAAKQANWDKYKEKYPPWWANFQDCIERGAGKHVPYYSSKRVNRKTATATNIDRKPDDTFVLEP